MVGHSTEVGRLFRTSLDTLVDDELQGVHHVVGDDHDQQAPGDHEPRREDEPEQPRHHDAGPALGQSAEFKGLSEGGGGGTLTRLMGLAFSVDRLFFRLPWGIGLYAAFRKPE